MISRKIWGVENILNFRTVRVPYDQLNFETQFPNFTKCSQTLTKIDSRSSQKLFSRTQDTEITPLWIHSNGERCQRHCNFPKVHLTWNKEMQLIKLYFYGPLVVRRSNIRHFVSALKAAISKLTILSPPLVFWNFLYVCSFACDCSIFLIALFYHFLCEC